jgi:hypothetical protein
MVFRQGLWLVVRCKSFAGLSATVFCHFFRVSSGLCSHSSARMVGFGLSEAKAGAHFGQSAQLEKLLAAFPELSWECKVDIS